MNLGVVVIHIFYQILMKNKKVLYITHSPSVNAGEFGLHQAMHKPLISRSV